MSWLTIIAYLFAGAVGAYLFTEICWYCFLIVFRIIDNYLNG